VLVGEFVQLGAAVEYRVASRLNPGEPVPAPARALNVTARIPQDVFLALELTNTDFGLKRKNIEALDSALPQSVPILTSSLTVSATEQAPLVRNPRRMAGIGAQPTVLATDMSNLAPARRTAIH